ncbi:MAG: hypothetical protein GY810_01000 [Aureispira sp.]|nr:hypothetical protein [Aureispira sp.]
MFEITRDLKYEDWLGRIDAVLDHSHCLSTDTFSDKYDFETAYNDGLRPREVVYKLENKFLDN